MSRRREIYILLPVHNRLESTRRFVESLLAQTYGNYHLVLIDDGSSDGTADYVKARVKSLTVITGRGDWWWGGGLHQGYLWLKKNRVNADDLVLMINNDTEFAPDFFQAAVNVLKEKPRTLLQAMVFSKQNGNSLDHGIYADWKKLVFEHAKDISQVNCLSTRGLFFRVGDFLDIGGFHPVILPHYLSDYEFTIRAHHKGYELLVTSEVNLTVDELATGSHVRSRSVRRYEFFRDYFSKRSSSNPFYWFAFVALACPWPWKPLNCLRVVYGCVATVFRKLLGIYNHRWQ